MNVHIAIEAPDSADVAAPESFRPERRAIGPGERRVVDRAIAVRLDGMGENPWTRTQTALMDEESGEVFHLLPIREHWAFAGTAKQRAADFVKTFSAFTNGRDNGNLQAFVLRPKLRKASLGELKQFVNDIGKKYGRVIDKAKAKGIARPVAMFIHIRWDIESKLWDVHLHVVVDVPPENLETLFLRLIGKFATSKHIEDVRNIGAWTNYSASWIVDHRNITAWPDDALREFWNIGPTHLMRKGGDFASFAATLKNKEVRWEAGKAIVTEREPSRRRQKSQQGRSPTEGLVGYANVRVDGRRRRCAIYKWQRDGGRHSTAMAIVPESKAQKPATNTGSIPPSAKSPPSRLRHRLAIWSAIWPYGTDSRPPRPIRRRLAQAGAVIASMPPGRLSRRRGRP